MSDAIRVVIVGGVAGGASAAARARRLSESAEIVLFERGEAISFANCGLPYHIGGAIEDRRDLLVQTPEAMRRRFRIDVRTRSEVVGIDREAKQVRVRDLAGGREYRERYDKLVLSPGAMPVRPPLPGADGERVMTLRTLSDMDAIKRAVDSDKSGSRRALVVGAGYIGLEMAEALRERGLDVTLVELATQVMAPLDPEMASPVHAELAMNGVDLRLGVSVEGFEELEDGLRVRLSTGGTVEADFAVMSVGVRPEAALAREAGLELGATGGIRTDDRMHTSDPDIYAVGDAVEVEDFVTGAAALVPLAGPANRQGRIAADNIFGRDSAYRRTLGTAICKVFGIAAGTTGASEKTLRSRGVACDKVYVHPASHATYYPGARDIALKLLFDPATGRVLGAQAVGADGVDKRIDVIATAIRAGMTVYDLEHLELSYAPPYGSAKDPVNQAGFVASNVCRGDFRQCFFEDLADLGGRTLLDVRTSVEFDCGSIPGSINIPLDDLRDRLGELPRDREVLVSCQVGQRGYVAARLLEANGFRARNLSGGYRTYKHHLDEPLPVDCPSRRPRPAKPSRPSTPSPRAPVSVTREIDACGLQCPGPIMRLKTEMDSMRAGEALAILFTDPGFVRDAPAWCRSTGNELVEVGRHNGGYRAVIAMKPADAGEVAVRKKTDKNKTIVVFSDDFDRAMASFVIASGAAAMGSEVTMFFTFWGLNILRRPRKVRVRKSLVERMFGMMMPRGAGRLTLSKMNMGGMGTRMMKWVMRGKKVASLDELIAKALESGVRLVACNMTMEIMGLKREELLEGVEEGGVALYLENAEKSDVNLFI